MTQQPVQEQILIGFFWALVSVFAASFLMVLPRLGDSTGVSPVQIVFFRYFFGALTIFPVFAWRTILLNKTTAASTTERPAQFPLRWHILRAFLATGRITCFVYAVLNMPFANVQAISQSNGVFMIVFAAIILGERVNIITGLSVLLCLCGAVLAAQPSSELEIFLTPPALAALAGAGLWGLEAVLIKHTASRDRFDRIIFVLNLTAVGIMAIPAALNWQTLSTAQIILFGLMGPVAIFTQIANILAFRAARASLLAPVRYLSVVVGLGCGFFMFGEWPGELALWGMGLIVMSGIVMAMAAASRNSRARLLAR